MALVCKKSTVSAVRSRAVKAVPALGRSRRLSVRASAEKKVRMRAAAGTWTRARWRSVRAVPRGQEAGSPGGRLILSSAAQRGERGPTAARGRAGPHWSSLARLSAGPGHHAHQWRPLHRWSGDARDLGAHRRHLPEQPARVPHWRRARAPRRGDRPGARLPAGRPLHQGGERKPQLEGAAAAAGTQGRGPAERRTSAWQA